MARIRKLLYIVLSRIKLFFKDVFSFLLSYPGINYFVLNYDGNMMQNELFVFKFSTKHALHYHIWYLLASNFNFKLRKSIFQPFVLICIQFFNMKVNTYARNPLCSILAQHVLKTSNKNTVCLGTLRENHNIQ